MAEELIIRVKIDGYSTGGQGATKDSGGGGGGALTAGVAVGATPSYKDLLKSGYEQRTSNAYIHSEKTTSRMAKQEGMSYENMGIVPGTSGGFRQVKIDGEELLHQTGYGKTAEMMGLEASQLTSKIKGLGSAAAWKAVSTAVAITQHRSGDSTYNAQLNNVTKLAGYGAALAMSGPAAPFVAIGIFGNEVLNAVSQTSNWNFDRRQEGNQIQNIKTIAGNVSYGRNRGSI